MFDVTYTLDTWSLTREILNCFITCRCCKLLLSRATQTPADISREIQLSVRKVATHSGQTGLNHRESHFPEHLTPSSVCRLLRKASRGSLTQPSRRRRPPGCWGSCSRPSSCAGRPSSSWTWWRRRAARPARPPQSWVRSSLFCFDAIYHSMQRTQAFSYPFYSQLINRSLWSLFY